MTVIRLAFDDDTEVSVSGMCSSICFTDSVHWVEITMEKDTAEKLLKGLSDTIEKWGVKE